jgi:hypothetical protein
MVSRGSLNLTLRFPTGLDNLMAIWYAVFVRGTTTEREEVRE